MNFEVLPEAELEAVEAAIWYDRQRLGLGDDFLTELSHAIDRMSKGPTALPRLESYPGPLDVRRCLLERFPYLVIFVCRPVGLVVVAISHARRRSLYWLERLG